MRNNYKSEWLKYKAEHKALRKAGLIKSGSAGRVYGFNKFKEFAEDQRDNEGLGTAGSRKQLLLIQKKFGGLTNRQIKSLYNRYKENDYTLTINVINKGGGKGIITQTRQEEVTRKFRNEQTFMRNLKARDVIAALIESGKTKKEALEEYGYKQDDEEVFE